LNDLLRPRLPRKLKQLFASILAILLSVAVQAGSAFALTDTSDLKRQSDELRLSSHPEWRAQLLYVATVLRRDNSIVDSPGFFLASEGKHDLRAELHATLDAMWSAQDPQKPDDHAMCKFPHRTRWLAEQLQLRPENLPKVNCPDLNEWLARQGIKGISLVFASYFINNPASMFGHTFLRLHRGKGPAGGEPNALLDSAVNFAANPTTDNALLYPFLGLTGGFAGTFSLMPYFLKIQEYNNSESRDLWEYPLNLSQRQVDNLMLTLWEVGPAQINYWYIDENCSYVLLLLLDTIDPTMKLAENFNVMVTPADTVRRAAAIRGFLAEPRYRPSALSKYMQREAVLSGEEIGALKQLIQRADADIPKILAPFPEEARSRMIDAALDYIDFDEQVAGNRLPEKQKQRRVDLLKHRAQLRIAPRGLMARPDQERPDKGHYSMRNGISLGLFQLGEDQDSQSFFADYDWRPTLHDLNSPATGYSRELQIKMLEFKFRAYDKPDFNKPKVKMARWFEVLSIPPVGRVRKPLSWALSLRSERSTPLATCLSHHIEGGAGMAAGAGPAKAFGIALARVAATCNKIAAPAVGPGLMMGVIFEPVGVQGVPYKLTLTGLWGRKFFVEDHPSQKIIFERSLRATFISMLNDAHELAGFAGRSTSDGLPATFEAGFSYGLYF